MREVSHLDELVIGLLMAATRHRGNDDDPAIHALTRAGAVPPPATSAARSVFDLAERIAAQPADMQQDSSASNDLPPDRAVDTVARTGDVVRVSGLAYPSGRWTAERDERERARRARQVVPKPSAAVRAFRVGKGIDMQARGNSVKELFSGNTQRRAPLTQPNHLKKDPHG